MTQHQTTDVIRGIFIHTKFDPKLDRTRVQIVESVRTGKMVRQKILRHVGVAHNDSEIEVIKRTAGQLMEQLRADRTHQMEFLPPLSIPVVRNSFAKPHVLKNWTAILVNAARRHACRLGSVM